ncbi:sulfite exporter TauE/SafE family protein [Pseudoalteromonas sp. MMG010]|uniref:sulfite exporter TauE/SafE family protein n=1 Tax=Pseudoalteromonas sp. MMG010 TaxID=2822685 RepID=UPI001B3A2F28|nr:sulfite exporter TauE/SafE family protein [Pseudoalteromonas sp. MMG010]MBQ4831913.1 sulfite exporter TauE/SafE family protein [Pseudoalteromonas sp. MMG010]
MVELGILVASCALLGCVVGFFAGLLGIGGGLIIVPVLSSLLLYFNISSEEHVLVISVATSLASILFTSTSSALAHHKNQNVPWEIAPWVMGGVAIGALISGFAASLIPTHILRIVFAGSVIFIAFRMILSVKKNTSITKPFPSGVVVGSASAILGGLAGLIGIGGGALIVPMLNHFSVDIKKSIGCAAACGIVIALFGSVGYISAGWQVTDLENGFAGFVYLPALFGIVITSWFVAPFGAKATHFLPVNTIKKIFAVLLVIIAIKMVFS